MNKLPTLLIGITATFLFSWVGLVMIPYVQLGKLGPIEDESGTLVAVGKPGVSSGARVYAAQGCVYCHTQQVRPEHGGSDIARGWGARASVARDYKDDTTVFLGTMRTGPDLRNVGTKYQSITGELHVQIYNARLRNKSSIMPSFRFLYEERKIVGSSSINALKVKDVKTGYEIVPTKEAEDLVAYLLSLNQNYSLPEAPTSEH
ncbi:MAG: cbb3-type cytochrome c oxidase subunit II [Verrucomicrobiota bacterium]|nr:cbb3-type cytochrome c oxidase subunit II [Verrucomicrobiota bacterium]